MVLITAQISTTSDELDIRSPFKFCQITGFQPATKVWFSPDRHQAEELVCNAIFFVGLESACNQIEKVAYFNIKSTTAGTTSNNS